MKRGHPLRSLFARTKVFHEDKAENYSIQRVAGYPWLSNRASEIRREGQSEHSLRAYRCLELVPTVKWEMLLIEAVVGAMVRVLSRK